MYMGVRIDILRRIHIYHNIVVCCSCCVFVCVTCCSSYHNIHRVFHAHVGGGLQRCRYTDIENNILYRERYIDR